MKWMIAALVATFAALGGAARAEVVDRTAGGFEVAERLLIAAPPAKVYEALLQIGRWWNPRHSYSGQSANLSLDLARGCFCEKLPKGEVRHMEIVSYDRGSSLILSGALGPLVTTAAAGHMSFNLADAGGNTELTVIYDVGGYAKGGFERWAPPVDAVLAEQVARLKTYAETGKPE